MSAYEATISAKGQVTIPSEVRAALSLAAGDKVEFQPLRDGSVLLRPLNLTLSDLFGAVPYDGPAKSIEEIDEGIAKAAAGDALGRTPSGRDVAA